MTASNWKGDHTSFGLRLQNGMEVRDDKEGNR